MLCWMCGKTNWIGLETTILERIEVAPIIVGKMVENRFRLVKMKDSQITRGRAKLRKIIRETIKKDLEINELDWNMVYDRILWCHLFYVANHT